MVPVLKGTPSQGVPGPVSDSLVQLKRELDSGPEEQTGALAPSLDTGCTIRTADRTG
jgi:hypothetical protein